MKTHRALGFLVGLILVGAASLSAQTPSKSNKAAPEVQKAYDLFIADFRKALRANDAAAVARLTRFPFHWTETFDAAKFRQNGYHKIFTAKVRSCIARGKSFYSRNGEGNDIFVIFCGLEIYSFTRTVDGFRFTDIDVND